jgi:hypothetical protein
MIRHLVLYIDTGTLQIFNGTLTEITCSAVMREPVFRVMERGLVYAYNQLPDLFGIEAEFSPAGSNVTLYINGTNRSNNVTVMCGYTDPFFNRFQVLFILTLEFASKFMALLKPDHFVIQCPRSLLGILPAPSNVHYVEDPAGYLQISWGPPILVSDEPGSLMNVVSVDSRITHFIIYITDESTTTVYNASGTSFTIGTDEIPCNFWYQVAAVSPAGVGEHSPPQILTVDSELAC